ncbi:MAG TPA: hypothetical protein VGL81_17205 [Polyangiaceae bacterium]|jgi:hypothetical protein
MRQRFMQVLQTDDTHEGTDATSDVLRRFWARAKPLPTRLDEGPARVVDLAQWIQSRRAER